MNTKKILIIVLLLMVIGLIFWSSDRNEVSTPTVEEAVLSESNSKPYESAEFGFSFRYPKNYFLEEKDLGNGERYHKVIILTEDTEENRLVREGKSPGREGPTAITIDIYQNNLDNLSIENWLISNDNSNFKLSDGTFEEIFLDGNRAVKYSWSGLYEADTVALRHGGNIISISSTYIFKEEPIRKDFSDILQSFNLKMQ